MLGIVGKISKSILTGIGYQIYRPTFLERDYLRSLWDDWFHRDILAFCDVYRRNREVLESISRLTPWVTDEALEKSLWRYGVPDDWNT